MQRSALRRSRRELSNAYFLAKFGFGTAVNEPFQVCPLSAYRSPRCEEESRGGQTANRTLAELEWKRSRRAAGVRPSAAAGAKRRSNGQMQISAELVPIPDASGCVPDASGCVGMRRDFEFQQISANSGKIPANLGKI